MLKRGKIEYLSERPSSRSHALCVVTRYKNYTIDRALRTTATLVREPKLVC